MANIFKHSTPQLRDSHLTSDKALNNMNNIFWSKRWLWRYDKMPNLFMIITLSSLAKHCSRQVYPSDSEIPLISIPYLTLFHWSHNLVLDYTQKWDLVVVSDKPSRSTPAIYSIFLFLKHYSYIEKWWQTFHCVPMQWYNYEFLFLPITNFWRPWCNTFLWEISSMLKPGIACLYS